MINRTYDANLIAPAIKFFLGTEDKIDPIEWISKPTNIALVNDNGDVSLFELDVNNVYNGHYYFQSRGKKALLAAREFLDTAFNSCYNIPLIMGLTDLTHLGARWLSRQIGFKSYGVVKADKPYEMFILTKKEFNG